MNPQEQREKLMAFLAKLPMEVLDSLSQKQIDAFLRVHEIGQAQGLVLGEMGGVCDGVRRTLAGEDSPSNLAAFISQDQNIEEDNRPKIPQIAAEIQQKIFDVVLPILKTAGFLIKEGRVPSQPTTYYQQPTTGEVPSPYAPTPSPHPYSSFPKGGAEGGGFKIPRPADGTLPLGKGEVRPAPTDSSLPATNSTLQASPIDERHLRALLRIAAGTTYPEEKLREKFEDLPEGLKRAITSVDTANAIQEIAKRNLLHVDQMGALASETGLVLLGLTHPVYFVTNLTSRLKVPQNKALEIAREVSGQILAKVRDALRTLHESSESSKLQNQTPPKKLSVLAAQEEKKVESLAEGTAQPFRSRTPYSPEAKWNTGVRDQLEESSERLSREELLRGIEQPKEIVGPTGWRPEKGAASGAPTTPAPPKVEPFVDTKVQPSSDRQEDFLEKKLNEPMSMPKTETRYTVDPYREPTE